MTKAHQETGGPFLCAPQTVDVLGMALSQQVTCLINPDETGD
jgi:hypothetical protein